MKLAIGYSTKDEIELTKQTYPRLGRVPGASIFWCDGSTTAEGQRLPLAFGLMPPARILGGADAALAWKLSALLNAKIDSGGYTHIALIENDVLFDDDWFEPTMALFEKGAQDGLDVGAVSPRSYVDRVLIQRSGYAVMHNLGAGAVVFTREAAEIVLRTFRTNWWPDNVRLFARLSGIDLRTYAAFRGNEQWVTTDWGWEAQLARHGLAALALTPAKCQMIGQKIPLEQQGLQLTNETHGTLGIDERAFKFYRDNLERLRSGRVKLDDPGTIVRQNGAMLFFPHQIPYLAGSKWSGISELRWSQGFGPFAYRAGAGGASLSVPVSGICAFLVSGGRDGARVVIQDTRSGFKSEPDLPNEDSGIITVNVPGTPVPRRVTLDMAEGAVFYGLHCNDAQMLDTHFAFDWATLPEAT